MIRQAHFGSSQTPSSRRGEDTQRAGNVRIDSFGRDGGVDPLSFPSVRAEIIAEIGVDLFRRERVRVIVEVQKEVENVGVEEDGCRTAQKASTGASQGVYRGELTRAVNTNESDEAGSICRDILQKSFETCATIDKDHHQLGRDFYRNRFGVGILRRVDETSRLFFGERFDFLILIDADEIPKFVVRKCGFPRAEVTRSVVVDNQSSVPKLVVWGLGEIDCLPPETFSLERPFHPFYVIRRSLSRWLEAVFGC